LKGCAGNNAPPPSTAEPECKVLPVCSENPGMAVGECYSAGRSALAQTHHKHHHRSQQGPEEPAPSQADAGEAITPLAACTGAKGEVAGVDCKKVK